MTFNCNHSRFVTNKHVSRVDRCTAKTLTRQLESTHTYATEQLDVSLNEIRGYQDKSTGTNTERNGYRDLMADIQDVTITIVVVHEISRLARSLRDLDRTVSQIVEADAEIHFVRDGLVLEAGRILRWIDSCCRCSVRSLNGKHG